MRNRVNGREAVPDKVKSLSELAEVLAEQRKDKRLVMQCHGVFDLVHPGHIEHFESAKRTGDILVVTITADKFIRKGPGRPLFKERVRANYLANLEIVDYVAIIHASTAVEAIKLLKPDGYVKGPDYRSVELDVTGKIADEEAAVNAHGGRLIVTDDEIYSSTSLINSFLDVMPEKTQRYLSKLSRKYSWDEMKAQLELARGLKTLVIGDAVIDQYDYCMQMGKSGKEPLVISKFIERESFAGGALGTANHVSSLVDRVQLVSLLGRHDTWRGFIDEHLTSKVRAKYFYRARAGTTIKRRYVSNNRNQKLFEVYFMEDSVLERAVEQKIIDWLKLNLKKYDLVVVNDFGHGFITDRIIKKICGGAKKLALNVQTNGANAGFNLVTKYSRADFVCVDEVELRYATHDRWSNLRQVARQVQKDLDCDLIVTTRGSSGSLTMSRDNGFTETPAFADHVIDPVGAGDAFFAFAAPAYAARVPDEIIPFVGNVAGSLATQIMGHRDVVELADVLKFMARLLK